MLLEVIVEIWSHVYFCLGKRLKYRFAAEMKLFNVKQGGVNDMQDIDKGNFNRSTTTHTCFTKEMIQCDT